MIAVVLGKKIATSQRPIALSIILNTMLDKFADDNRLEVAEPEIDAYMQAVRVRHMETIIRLEAKRKDMERAMNSPVLSAAGKARKAKEIEQLEALLKVTREEAARVAVTGEAAKKERQLAAQRIIKWKANQALFRKYGGRVIGPIQEPESFDGKMAYFREQAAAGCFRILDKNLESFFWNILTNEVLYTHLFVSDKDREGAMSHPWWLAGGRVSNSVPPVSGGAGARGN